MKNLFLFLFLIVTATNVFGQNPKNSTEPDPTLLAKANGFLQNSSMGFEQNIGQVSGDHSSKVKYFSQIGDLSVFLLGDAIVYQFHKKVFPEGYDPSNAYRSEADNEKHEELRKRIKLETYRMDVQLVGANPSAKITTEGKSNEYVNYYNNNLLGVYNYSKLTYHDIYPNIDWVIYNKNGQLKYDFVVRPGGDPKQIKLKTNYVDHPKLNSKGGLEFTNILGTVSEDKPVSFQNNASIPTQFILSGNEISFEISAYDPSQTLTIDPVIRIWGTYYGGTNGGSYSYSYSTATDASGNVYITGETTGSVSMLAGGYQTTYGGGARDAFLYKFNSCGSRVWTTYFGGTINEIGRSLALDASGNVYMAGYTNSTTSIAGGGHQNTFGGGNLDAFLAKFNASGVRQWSTYYGGTSWDYGYDCAVDGSGNVFLVGWTNSPNGTGAIAFGTHQNVLGGNDDGFVAKFNSNGVRQWGAYYGGTSNDYIYSCRTDASGNVYIAGATGSTTAISTVGSHQAALSGNFDGFVAKFNGTGTRQWGTYYGGTTRDVAYGCTLDGSANVYIAGETNSLSGIALNGHQNTYSAGLDGFLVKFNTNGVREWGTYYGGAVDETVWNCMTNSTGDIFMTGQTTSSSNISSLDGYQTTAGGGNDAFLIKFNTSGVRQWGTYYGGAGEDRGYDCAMDNSNNIFITGATNSTTNIAFAGFQNTVLAGPGYFDAFLAKLNESCAAAVVPAVSISSNFTVICAGSSVTFTATPTNGGSGPTYQWKKNGVNVGTNSPTFTTSTIANGDLFTVELTSNDQCASPCAPVTSNSITITVNPVPVTPTTSGVQNFCLSGTVSQLQATGTNIQWYSVGIGGTPLAPSTPLVAGLYYVSQTVNGCESFRPQVTVNITIPAAPTGNSTQTFCITATVSELTATGTTIKWYSTPTGGTQLSPTTFLVDGTTYYASQTIAIGASNCEGTNRFAVTVTLTSALCNSLHFDGVNDAVDLPASTHTNITAAGTLEAWIKTTNAGTGYRGVLVRQGRHGLFLNNNQLMSYNYFDNIATTYSGATLNDNQWHHIVLTFQNGVNNGSQLYIDGTAVGAPFYHANGTQTANFRIGNNGFTTQPYQGQIDNVRLWGRLLTAAEISASFSCGNPTTTALAGSYNFNQGIPSGTNTTITTLTDNSGLNNNGTLANFALTGTTSNWISGLDCVALACPTPTGNPTQVICNSGTVSNLSANGTNIQWYIAASGGSPLPSNTPVQNGVTYYASQTTVNCESSSRLAVTVTINTTPEPTGNANQNFCNTATVANLTATGTAIQWFNVASGGTALASGTALTNGSTYYASQTISGCTSATRLAVTVTINVTPAPTGSVTQSFCNSATVANLTATGTSIQWFNVASGGTALAAGTALTNGSTYYASQTISGCTSTTRLAVTVSITAASAPTGSAAQTFCNSATVANLTATGTAIQWFNVASGGTALAAGTALTNGSTYYASQTISGCTSATRLAVTVTINVTPAPTGSVTQSFCNSATVANLTATGTSIQWFNVASGGTALAAGTALTNGSTYYASQTISGCTSATRLAVTVSITAASAPTGSAAQTFCNSATVSNLSATGTAIQWYTTSTGGTALAAVTSLLNGTTYYASQTISGCESATRLAVTVTINAPAAPTGSASQTFCNSATVANLTATGTAIQWYNAPTGGTALAAGIALTNGSTYYASQTISGCTSATRLAVTVTINVTPAPTGASTQEYCSPSTLNGLPANVTGSNLLYYSAPTGGSNLPFNTPMVNGTTYYVSQTVSGCESVSRLAVTTTVYTFTLNMTAANPQQFCNSATVSNLVASGTPGATISWFSNSNGWQFGGTPLPAGTQLVNNTTYYAGQSFGTNNLCKYVGTAGVQVFINSPSAPTGSASQTFCNSGTVANLTATGTTIQWYAASTGGSALSAGTALVNGTTYYASQTVSGCESAARLAVAVTINVTTAPTGAATQTVCSGAIVGDLSATGTTIQWYAAASGGSPLASSTALTNGTTYYASQTVNGCVSINRFAVNVVFGIPSAPTGSAAQSFCNSATVANLLASGSNIQWYTASTGGTALPSGAALSNGTTYYASQTSGGCESTSRLAVTVTISAPTAPTGSATQSFCNSATVANLSATGSSIQWYAASTGGTPLSAGASLSTGTTYFASQTISGCESTTRFAVTVTINSPAAPTGTTTQSFCNSATAVNLTAIGSGIQWYSASTGGTALSSGTTLANGTTYYASQIVSGCESATRFAVTVTINVPAAPTGAATQTVCSGAIVGDLSATGTTIQWYAAASGGSPLASSTALSNGTTYYASQTVSGCESVSRFAVNVIFGIPSAPTGSASQTFCNSATVANLTATGSAIQWYTATTGGTPLSASTLLTTGTTYFASQTSGGCESTNRLSVAVTINAPTAPTGSATQSFCNSATVANLTATGSTIQWYTTSTGGTPLSAGTSLSTGTTYFASQTIGSCVSTNRLAVTVTINSPVAPTGTTTQSFCNSATVANLSAIGSGIQWYSASTGGTALSVGTALVDGTTYFASQTISGCESNNRLGVTVSVNAIPAAPTGTANQSFCNSGTVANLTAAGSGIQWYSASTGGTPLSAGTSLTTGTTYFASQSSSGCESATRFAVAVSITVTPAPTGAATQNYCNSATVADLVATGSAIQWYTTSTGGTALSTGTSLTDGATYYASQNLNSCEGTSRLEVTVSIIAAAPTGTANQIICGSGTLADLAINGSNISWYDAVSGGNVLTPSTALIDGSTYFASQTIGACESINRLGVTVSVNPIPDAPTGTSQQTFCDGATLDDILVTGTDIEWYLAATGGTVVSGTQTLVNSIYYASQTINGCESSNRLSVDVTINEINSNVTENELVLTAAQTGATYTWLDCNNANQPIPGANGQSYTVTTNGSYAVEIVVNGCSEISACTLIATVGLNDAKLNLLSVYPNPTNGQLTITCSTPTTATISSAIGTILTTVKLNSVTNIDISTYPPGVYFIRTNEGGTLKVIKK